MVERPTTSDLAAWRVADLSDGFADRVLARLDDLEVQPVRLVPTPAPSSPRRTNVLGIACAAAAAALVLLWLLRPEAPAPPPPPSQARVSIAAPPPPEESGLEHAEVVRAIEEHLQPRAKLCYEAFQINGTPTSGQVIINVEVVRRNGRGIVTHAEIDPISELDDRPFRDCLLDTARAMLFAPPRGDAPVHIELPIEFFDPWDYEQRR